METVKLLTLCLLALPAAPSWAQQPVRPPAASTRDDLSRLHDQVEDRKKELEKYRKTEKDLSRYVSFLKQQEEKASRAGRELDREIQSTERQISEAERKKRLLQSAEGYWKENLAVEAGQYYLMRRTSLQYYGSDAVLSRIFLESAIYDKTLLLERLNGEDERHGRMIASWQAATKTLVSRSRRLREENRDRQRQYERKMAALSDAHDRASRLEKEVEELRNSAKSLLRFLENVEKKKAEEASTAAGKSAQSSKKRRSATRSISAAPLSVPRHSLQWPLRGRVVSQFGREEVPALRTWIVREGIKISAAKGAAVSSVYEGQVIYSGPFRSYGNVVIVDHRKGFFTVYGLLSDMAVSKGDAVTAGMKIGSAGVDTQDIGTEARGGALYFEIRSGADAVNPLDWLSRQ